MISSSSKVRKKNYHTYKRKLYVMIQFVIKYRHMFSAKKTFILHIDHKSLVKFINALKHENIYVRWVNKLKSLNVTIKHIKNKKNQIVDDLFKVIFNEANCKFDQFVKKLYFEIKTHENDIEWFWKSDKKDFYDMLKKLSTKNQKRKVNEYDNKAIVRVGWTFFYVKKQTFSLCFDLYTSSNCSKKFISYAVVCSFDVKMLNVKEQINVNEKWYSNFYRYYAYNVKSMNLDKSTLVSFKQKLNNYRWNLIVRKLLHRNEKHWCVCINKEKIAFLLQKVHDQTNHFFLISFSLKSRIKSTGHTWRQTFDFTFSIVFNVFDEQSSLD